jgi:hypothetical protein
MKKGRCSEAQIGAILQQQASGQTVAQIVREHGLSEATFPERSDILRVEKQVCRGQRRRTHPAQAPGRRASQAQADVRGPELREPSY